MTTSDSLRYTRIPTHEAVTIPQSDLARSFPIRT